MPIHEKNCNKEGNVMAHWNNRWNTISIHKYVSIEDTNIGNLYIFMNLLFDESPLLIASFMIRL